MIDVIEVKGHEGLPCVFHFVKNISEHVLTHTHLDIIHTHYSIRDERCCSVSVRFSDMVSPQIPTSFPRIHLSERV
jgi:hypothetical protein